MIHLYRSTAALLLVLLALTTVQAQTTTEIDQQFDTHIKPLLKAHCLSCHEGAKAEAMLDLTVFQQTSQVAERHQTWSEISHRVAQREMPPEDAATKISDAERQQLVDWIDQFKKLEAQRHAGDPGRVTVRRLSNSELNYTVRDLTGIDIRPSREFPVDPANEAGFDNSSESLSTSPALVNKSLAAARAVAEHMVLTPDGIDFAPFPVQTDTDRDKYCVRRIVDFYQSQPTDLADYFHAAWQRRVSPEAHSLESLAKGRLSLKYLKIIQAVLEEDGPTLPPPIESTDPNAPEPNRVQPGMGPLAVIRRLWLDLPNDSQRDTAAKQGCVKLRDFVLDLRIRLEPDIKGLNVRGIHNGSQPFVLWKNDQYASYRQRPFLDHLRKLSPGADTLEIATALSVPEDESASRQFQNEVERFCRIFPDAFYVSERGRDYVGVPKAEQEKGRLLSAGFHSMMGYYRDDEPLMKLILSPEQCARLDRLWQELDFITSAPMRQYSGFVWFERTDSVTMRGAEFDFARAEDKGVTTPAMIERLAETYLAKADKLKANETARAAIEAYFRNISAQVQAVESARRLAEPHHLEAILRLADRAYRRDLLAAERQQVRDFYEQLRKRDGLSHEEAMQDLLVSILVSPQFNYRTDLAATGGVTLSKPMPLSANDLASRLSYFLWSSMPDDTLRQVARDKQLTRPEVLTAQLDRMISDPKSQALAIEFGAQWLGSRQFEQHNSVDRQLFPGFDDRLRASMYEEPVRFIETMFREDRSLLDCLYADYVIVDRNLARHYGLQWSYGDDDDRWHQLPSGPDRGGLSTMSVFLTMNAPGRRTSPVKRGYWLVKRLLGEHIPAPPPNVPELPGDESSLGELSLRDVLARHREHVACAGCHQRFDALGLVFENYGPVGELRQKDLSGKPVDTHAQFPGGLEGQGIGGLKEYLRTERQAEFVDNFLRKLLAFALGRTLLLSDEPLIDQMRSKLVANEFRVRVLLETIVTSPQFMNKRG